MGHRCGFVSEIGSLAPQGMGVSAGFWSIRLTFVLFEPQAKCVGSNNDKACWWSTCLYPSRLTALMLLSVCLSSLPSPSLSPSPSPSLCRSVGQHGGVHLYDPSGHPRWSILQSRACTTPGPLLPGTAGKSHTHPDHLAKRRQLCVACSSSAHGACADRPWYSALGSAP